MLSKQKLNCSSLSQQRSVADSTVTATAMMMENKLKSKQIRPKRFIYKYQGSVWRKLSISGSVAMVGGGAKSFKLIISSCVLLCVCFVLLLAFPIHMSAYCASTARYVACIIRNITNRADGCNIGSQVEFSEVYWGRPFPMCLLSVMGSSLASAARVFLLSEPTNCACASRWWLGTSPRAVLCSCSHSMVTAHLAVNLVLSSVSNIDP